MTRSADWIAHHAAVRPDKAATIDQGTGTVTTYAELADRVARLAAALAHDFGITEGARVAVLANNDGRFFEVEFACWRLGAVMVPLNWRLTQPELEFIVGDCGPTVIVCDHDFVEMSTALAAACHVPHVIDWEGGSGDVADYEEVLAAADPTTAPTTETSHDTLLTIMYTSGTTGRPKGAMITQGMTLWNAINSVSYFELGPNMVNLVVLPLFHTGGLNCFANPALHWGGTNVVMRSFDPAVALENLTSAEVGITHTLCVPANFLFMSQVPAFADATFPTLQVAGVGGSPTPVPLLQTWAAKGFGLQQGFGMTETSPLVLAQTAASAAAKVGSAGQPAMHVEVRIVTEDGREADVDEMGELWVRGPNVTPGYWNRPDATAETITDGWLHTGDAARVDADGHYYIVDRWKDMYISGGENVYPAEIESAIYELNADPDAPAIVECAIIGVPDEKWVEVGRAIVVRADTPAGAALDEATIINHCRERLARFKVPQSVVFIDEIPHNATGKVLKRVLRDTHGG